MRYTERYIPPNIGTGTIFGGMFKLRNVIEAIICIAIIYFISLFTRAFLPRLVELSIRFILWGVIGIAALRGIGGEPLSVYLLNFINYSNTRNYASLRPPQKENELTRRKEKKSALEKLIGMMFTEGKSKK